MSPLPTELPLLLVEAGPWWVGIDAASVTHVGRPEPGAPAADCSLESLLGAERQRPTRRLLVVGEGDGSRVVAVSSAVDDRAVPIHQMTPLPGLLRALGAPAWWVGVAWLDGRLLLLLDLYEAAVAAPQFDG